MYPISLADLVLRLAELGLFELVWSDHLLAEVERVLVEYKGLPVAKSRYFTDCIRQTFPEGRIPPHRYEHLVASRQGPDPGDHVHSAAVVAGDVTVVLSADRRGYPVSDIGSAKRRDPDAYLTHLLRRWPVDVLRVVDQIGASLRVPCGRHEVLERLRKAGLERFTGHASAIS